MVTRYLLIIILIFFSPWGLHSQKGHQVHTFDDSEGSTITVQRPDNRPKREVDHHFDSPGEMMRDIRNSENSTLPTSTSDLNHPPPP